MVIWSTDFGVDFKMSATYLRADISHCTLTCAKGSLTGRLADARKQRLYYRQGRSMWGLALGVEGKKRRRSTDCDCRPKNGKEHRSSASIMGISMTLLRMLLRFPRLPTCLSLEIDGH